MHARLGLIGGYTHSEFELDGRASSGSANSIHLGAYGGLQLGSLGLRAGAAYSWHFVDTSRTAAFGSFAENLDASYDAGTAQVFGEAGYRIDTASASFEPFANVAYVNRSMLEDHLLAFDAPAPRPRLANNHRPAGSAGGTGQVPIREGYYPEATLHGVGYDRLIL